MMSKKLNPCCLILAAIIFFFFISFNNARESELFDKGVSYSSNQKKTKISDFLNLENKIFKSFYDGNLYSLYDNIENLLYTFPVEPESILYYYYIQRLSDVYGARRAEKTLRRLIDFVIKSNNKKKNLLALILKLELEKLLYKYNRNEAEKISKEISPIRRWILLGPYYKYGSYDIDYPFMPEVTTSLKKIKFKKKEVIVNASAGILNFGKYVYPEKGIIYAATAFNSAKPVKIRIYSSCFYNVFLNGKEILNNSKENDYKNCRVVRISGSNKITIMLKILLRENNDSSSLRIILLDDNDEIIKTKINSEDLAFNDFDYTEEIDYPFSYFYKQFSKNSSSHSMFASFRLGGFFDELNSGEAIAFYKKAARKSNDPVKLYFYAMCLIGNSDNEKNSARYAQGFQILDNLAKSRPDFLPAQHKGFQKLIERRNFKKAYLSGKKLLKRGALYLPYGLDYARLLLNLGYEKEFEDLVEDLRQKFPHSISPLQILADFYEDRNISKAIDLHKVVLDREYSERSLQKLLIIYSRTERYNDIVNLIDKCDYDNRFKKELIESLIDSKKYDKARKKIFEELVIKADPYYDFTLGRISYFENTDPTMHWGKMLSINPSYFEIKDFASYLKMKKMDSPFEIYRDAGLYDKIQLELKKEITDNTGDIFNRTRIYLLNKDGSNRVFCEDVIVFKDQKSIVKWGEYQIPYSGKVVPVLVRVYERDGSYNDSYRIHKSRDTSYISFSNIISGSIAHIAYYLDNPVENICQSNFIAVPYAKIQNFNESISHFSLKVIAPLHMAVNFSFNRDLFIESKQFAENNIYSIELNNLKAVRNEEFMGNELNYLPWYAFSTIKNMNDFVLWYKGRIKGALHLDTESIKHFLAGKKSNEKVRKIYDYINNEIELQGNRLFSPDRARDTLFFGRGSVEDKVILAKSILAECGIKSYISLASKEDYPRPDSYISPYIFTNILLYAPMDAKFGYWLDFSNQGSGSSFIDEALIGTDALVIMRNGFEYKTLSDHVESKMSSDFNVNIDSRGNASFNVSVNFFGRNNCVRGLYKNKIYNEQMINYYFNRFISSINISEYNIGNTGNSDIPFAISIKGDSYSIAHAAAGRITFQPVIMKSDLYQYVKYARRKHPLIIKESINEEATYLYHLPVEYTDIEVNRNWNLINKFGSVKIYMKKYKKSNELKVFKEISIEKTKILPNEYQEFVDFCLKIVEAEGEIIVLKN